MIKLIDKEKEHASWLEKKHKLAALELPSASTVANQHQDFKTTTALSNPACDALRLRSDALPQDPGNWTYMGVYFHG